MEDNGGGGNGNGGNNGCTFKAFQSCNPKEYDGKGGAIVLTRWIEKMENVIDNSGCAKNQKVSPQQEVVRLAMAYEHWDDFKALMVEEFCPSNELENEFWNHKIVGANHAAYTDRFHELAKLVPHLVTPVSSVLRESAVVPDKGVMTIGSSERSCKSGGSWKDNKNAKNVAQGLWRQRLLEK
ncbi:hypothetical protein Tco_0721647 [Tanacetum coccineum]